MQSASLRTRDREQELLATLIRGKVTLEGEALRELLAHKLEQVKLKLVDYPPHQLQALQGEAQCLTWLLTKINP